MRNANHIETLGFTGKKKLMRVANNNYKKMQGLTKTIIIESINKNGRKITLETLQKANTGHCVWNNMGSV